MQNMQKLRRATLYLLGFGLPLLSLPGIFADTFGLSKLLLLLAGVLVLLLIWTYQVFQQDAISWRATPFDLPLVALGVVYLLSTLLSPQNTITSLTSPSGAGAILLLICFYFLSVQTAHKPQPINRQPALTGLTHAALLLAVWSLLNAMLKLTNFSFILPTTNYQLPIINFSPLGNTLIQMVFLLIVLIFLAQGVVSNLRNLRTSLNSPAAIKLIVLSLGLLSTLYNLFSNTSPLPLLPYPFGWAIAIETFKNAPLFGSGAANFLSAFTRFKPATINAGNYWNITFNLSSDFYLHLLTTTGFFGLAAYLFFAYRLITVAKETHFDNKNNHNSLLTTLLAMLLLQLLFPFPLPLLFVEFAFLAAAGVTSAKQPVFFRMVKISEGFIQIKSANADIVETYEEIEVETNP